MSVHQDGYHFLNDAPIFSAIIHGQILYSLDLKKYNWSL